MNKLKPINILPGIATLLLFLIAATDFIAIQIKNKQQAEIDAALNALQNSHQLVNQVENTLESLYLAENQFREYALNSDRLCFEHYRSQVSKLVSYIDTLQKVNSLFQSSDTTTKVVETIYGRNKEVEKFLRLQQLADSIWIVAAVIDSVPFVLPETNPDFIKFTISKVNQSVDTTQQTTTSIQPKKGFFGKLKSLFKDDQPIQTTTSKTVVTSNMQTKEVQDSTVKSNGPVADIILQTTDYYQKQLKKLYQQRNKLRQSELKIIRMNNSLLSEIKLILSSMKKTVMKSQEFSVNPSSGSIAYSSKILHRILFSSIIASLFFAILTFYMVLNNRKYQLRLIESRQKAIDEAKEKSRFLAYFSHEFRTPISSVLGFAEQMEQTQLSPEQQDILSGLLSSSEILLTTVNDILDLSKLQVGKMTFLNKPFIPEETAQQVMKSFANIARNKNLVLNYTSDNAFITLLGDEIRLKQVMNNLVGNALKYTEKGNVNVKVIVVPNNETAWLQISVIDTGFGIVKEQLGKIFDEYSRVHNEDSSTWIVGTGLGLPVTKKLVEGMNGTIEVKSEIGIGSEFIIHIPYTMAANKDIKSNVPKIFKGYLPEGIRLLVADDAHMNTMLLKSIFKRIYVDVDCVENGIEAMKFLESRDYNLVITDIHMPLMGGMELTRKIRNHHNAKIRVLPVMVLTGSISDETVEEMKEAGVNDCLYKPFQQKDLFEMIKKILPSV